jgi:sugar phosphate isomerase/epimerase
LPQVTHHPAVGFAARLFDGSRSTAQEIEFGAANGFAAIQFRGDVDLNRPAGIQDPVAVGIALRQNRLEPTMELLIALHVNGQAEDGRTAVEILQANLPVIETLGIDLVHWHLYPTLFEDPANGERLGSLLVDLCQQGVAFAHDHGFTLGIENNPPWIHLLSGPDSCASLLQSVPGLRLVWDVNHSPTEHDEYFVDLAPHLSALHVSDTPRPEVNHHLPLGLGNIDTAAHVRAVIADGFQGPAVLEIGGLPASGGYGLDTDDALVDSRQRLTAELHRKA